MHKYIAENTSPTKDREWQQWAAALVRDTITKHFPRLSQPLSSATLLASVIPTAFQTGRIDDPQHILWVLQHAIKDRKIGEVTEALNTGWGMSNYLRDASNDGIVYEQALKSDVLLDDPEHWRYLIDSLGIEQQWAFNPQGQKQATQVYNQNYDAEQRSQLISELTGG